MPQVGHGFIGTPRSFSRVSAWRASVGRAAGERVGMMGSGKMISGYISPAQEKAFLELHKRNVLKWLPWVGNSYEPGGLLVVGESNYANDKAGATSDIAVAAVNGNWRFTNRVVEVFCLSRSESNGTFDGVTYLLKKSSDAEVSSVSSEVWNSFAYMDLIQEAMKGIGWKGTENRTKSERPGAHLWKPGWVALAEVIKILKPGSLMFVGSELAYKCNKKWLPQGIEGHITNVCKPDGKFWLRTGWVRLNDGKEIKVVSIPNPHSAHGYLRECWRNAFWKCDVVKKILHL